MCHWCMLAQHSNQQFRVERLGKCVAYVEAKMETQTVYIGDEDLNEEDYRKVTKTKPP